jgi:hypothetical protein
MKVARLSKVLLLAIFVVVIASMFQSTAMGQCAMCRASLGGSGNASFIKQFNIGVLVLLVPPVAMFCSFFVMLRRNRGVNEAKDEPADESKQ